MDNNNFIITINRECGSGGGEIARKLGENLGVKVYGRAMLEGIAEQFDMTIENIERIKAQKSNWWNDFCRFYQLLFCALMRSMFSTVMSNCSAMPSNMARP